MKNMREPLYYRTAKHKIARLGITLLLLCTLLYIVAAPATALGIAPSRELMTFDGQPHTISARIINNEHKDMNVVIYAQGDLAEYVKLSESAVMIPNTEYEHPFTYTVTLPQNLTPGTKDINIMVMEVPTGMNVPESAQNMMISTITVIHQLKVTVPYPGSYAEGILYVSEGNVNESTTFDVDIVNRGTDTIPSATGELVIKGPTNEEIARLKATPLSTISPKTAQKFEVNWIANVNPGVYYAEFIVTYAGKQLVLRKTFMVGDYHIDISDINVKDFKLGTIAKFNMDLVNKWNEPVDNVYAEIQITDSKGTVIADTKTITTTVTPLTTSTIYAYWDTQGIGAGTYDVHAILHYNGKTTERIYKALVGINAITIENSMTTGNAVTGSTKSASSTSTLVILVGILVAINIGWLIYFKFLKKKK